MRKRLFSTNLLSFERIGDAKSNNVAIFIHGVLGSKKNMRTPAREFIKLNPNYSSIIVDLRGHGMTPDLPGSNTIEQCAYDLKILIENEIGETPQMLCAHSLGGKVALKYLNILYNQKKKLPTNTWILDSLPGKYTFDDVKSDSQSVPRVIESLEQIKEPFESRKVVMDKLIQMGISSSIAQWLGTSVIDTPEGNKWAFRLPVIKEIFHDFCNLDMWPFLENYSEFIESSSNDNSSSIIGNLHYVRAGRQKKWSPEILQKFEDLKIQSNSKIQLYTMPNVGHWMHSEDLPGLLKIIQSNQVTE